MGKHPELELVAMNPVVVFGLILGYESGTAIGSSLGIIKRMMTGEILAAPLVSFGCVDVRDVAILHALALDLPETKGKRFLVVAGKGEFITGHDVGAELGHPIHVMPDWLARFLGLFLDDLWVLKYDISVTRTVSTKRVQETFDFEMRTWQEAVKARADSLRQFGIV